MKRSMLVQIEHECDDVNCAIGELEAEAVWRTLGGSAHVHADGTVIVVAMVNSKTSRSDVQNDQCALACAESVVAGLKEGLGG